jgi:hypothetical protein
MIVDETGQLIGKVANLNREEQLHIYYKKWVGVKLYVEAVNETCTEDIDSEYVTNVLIKDVRELMAIAVDKEVPETRLKILAMVIQHTNKVPTYQELRELINVI